MRLRYAKNEELQDAVALGLPGRLPGFNRTVLQIADRRSTRDKAHSHQTRDRESGRLVQIRMGAIIVSFQDLVRSGSLNRLQ